jgi:hypothetical protein
VAIYTTYTHVTMLYAIFLYLCQADLLAIRLAADLIVSAYSTHIFIRPKIVSVEMYAKDAGISEEDPVAASAIFHPFIRTCIAPLNPSQARDWFPRAFADPALRRERKEAAKVLRKRRKLLIQQKKIRETVKTVIQPYVYPTFGPHGGDGDCLEGWDKHEEGNGEGGPQHIGAPGREDSDSHTEDAPVYIDVYGGAQAGGNGGLTARGTVTGVEASLVYHGAPAADEEDDEESGKGSS